MKKIILGLLLIGFAFSTFADVPPLAGVPRNETYKQLMLVQNLTGSTNTGLEATLREFMDGGGQSSGLLISKAASQTDKIALQFSTVNKLSFRDNALIMYSSADGQLDIDADTELEFAIGKLDVNSSDNITIDCSDNTKSIAIGGATSGLAVSIGHTTSETTVRDNLTTTGDTAVGGALAVTGATTTKALTIVGAVDANATTFDVDATDDIDIDTSDTTGGLALATVTSGVPISIGHTTSETTVNDNLTITGTTTLDITDLGAKFTAGANEIEGSAFDINGGAIDGAVIGGASAAAAKFTTLNTSGAYTAASTIDMDGNEFILDTDGDTSITADTDDRIDFKVGNNDELKLNASALYPSSDGGLDLGVDASTEWNDIYLLGDVDCEDDLRVGDDATISGLLSVTEKITATAAIDANGNITSSGLLAHDGTPQSLSGAGAINATTSVTLFTSTGTDALTIANGTINGQMKYIIHIVDGGAGTLTGANLLGTSVVFTNAGENATLMWITSIGDWVVTGVSEDIYTP